MAGNTRCGVAASRARKAVRSPVRPGHPAADQHRGHRALLIVRARGQAAARREDHRPQQRAGSLPGQRRAARRRRAAGLLAAGQGRADELTAALQARWEESLRRRAAIDPRSRVPLLDNLLAPFRAAPAGHPGPVSG